MMIFVTRLPSNTHFPEDLLLQGLVLYKSHFLPRHYNPLSRIWGRRDARQPAVLSSRGGTRFEIDA